VCTSKDFSPAINIRRCKRDASGRAKGPAPAPAVRYPIIRVCQLCSRELTEVSNRAEGGEEGKDKEKAGAWKYNIFRLEELREI